MHIGRRQNQYDEIADVINSCQVHKSMHLPIPVISKTALLDRLSSLFDKDITFDKAAFYEKCKRSEK